MRPITMLIYIMSIVLTSIFTVYKNSWYDHTGASLSLLLHWHLLFDVGTRWFVCACGSCYGSAHWLFGMHFWKLDCDGHSYCLCFLLCNCWDYLCWSQMLAMRRMVVVRPSLKMTIETRCQEAVQLNALFLIFLNTITVFHASAITEPNY